MQGLRRAGAACAVKDKRDGSRWRHTAREAADAEMNRRNEASVIPSLTIAGLGGD